LKDRLTTAGVAASVLAETNTIAPRLQEELLRTTGAVAISLDQGSRRSLIAMSERSARGRIRHRHGKHDADPGVDHGELRNPGTYSGRRRDAGHRRRADGLCGAGRRRASRQTAAKADMLAFSGPDPGAVAGDFVITASLVYISPAGAVHPPAAPADPLHGTLCRSPEDASRIITVSGRQDELGDAEIRLAAMEEALSRALQQKQRLADLGLAVSKINHDLRNLLASAQLFLERLEHVPDPTVSRLAPKILATLDRAVGYTQAVMSYGKAQERAPQAPASGHCAGSATMSPTCSVCRTTPAGHLRQSVPDDRNRRRSGTDLPVLLNLCRNSLQALEAERDAHSGRRIMLDAEREGSTRVRITCLRHRSRHSRKTSRKALFKAFHSGSKHRRCRTGSCHRCRAAEGPRRHDPPRRQPPGHLFLSRGARTAHDRRPVRPVCGRRNVLKLPVFAPRC
jgi:signal transduction histidine kinase